MAESANKPMLSAVTEGHQNVGGISNSSNNSESTIAKQSLNNNATRTNQRTTRGRPKVITSPSKTTTTTTSNSGGTSNNQVAAASSSTKITRKKAEASSHNTRHTRPGSSNSQKISTKNPIKATKSPRKRIIDTDTEDTEEETHTRGRKKRVTTEAVSVTGTSSTIASRTRSHGNVPETETTTITKNTRSSRKTRTNNCSTEDTSSAEEYLHRVKKAPLKHTKAGGQQSTITTNPKLKRIIRENLSGSKIPTEGGVSRNLRSHHYSSSSGFVANQVTLSHTSASTSSTTSAGVSGVSNQSSKAGSGARLASNSSGLSIVAVPKKRQKVGEYQRGPDNSGGYSDKLSNLGARLARSIGGREPQSNSSDAQVS